MTWEYNEIRGWKDWSSPEGYRCSQYSDDPKWYAGINLGPAYLDLGDWDTLAQAQEACEVDANSHKNARDKIGEH